MNVHLSIYELIRRERMTRWVPGYGFFCLSEVGLCARPREMEGT
jgi:hypothetical protein